MKEYIIKVNESDLTQSEKMCLKDYHPTDLVRCKNCKHGEPCKNGKGEDAIECFNSDVCLEVICRNHEWFCADGERRTDDA